jgi:hypothetical protein
MINFDLLFKLLLIAIILYTTIDEIRYAIFVDNFEKYCLRQLSKLKQFLDHKELIGDNLVKSSIYISVILKLIIIFYILT